ncbi:type 4a pilus biogenesis protein PilO [Candidatus Berkelbacteria bacterium]|nr:type 4a pilus biogenesis protein PilO [Candidatus Berkelbacteria bacterium]
MANEVPVKSNAFLWSVLGVLGVIGVGYFFVSPQVDSWKTARAEAAAAEADTVEIQQQIQQVQSLDQQLNGRQADLDRLDLAIPNEPSFDELLYNLETISQNSGVVIDSIQPVGISEEIPNASATINMRGPYLGVRQFLEQLEQNLRFVKVSNLNLGVSSNTEGATEVVATFQIDPAQAVIPILEEQNG